MSYNLFPARRPGGSPAGGRFTISALAITASAKMYCDFVSYPEEAKENSTDLEVSGGSVREALDALTEQFRALGKGAEFLHEVLEGAWWNPSITYVAGGHTWRWLPGNAIFADHGMWFREH